MISLLFLVSGTGNWTEEKESIRVAYELDDGNIADTKPVEFIGGIPEGYRTNNPSPMLLKE